MMKNKSITLSKNIPYVILCVLVLSIMMMLSMTRIALAASTATMYRLYNPNSGEHFYTASAHERDVTVMAGWTDEGVGWVAPSHSNTPVYRLWNPNEPLGDHHYTMSKHEYDELIRVGWHGEGIGWYSDDARSIPLYRVYNPNAYPMGLTGAHHYTINKNESTSLISGGWNDEGVAWYGVKAFTVKFISVNDVVLSEQAVAKGANAIPPANPSREGHTFIGWDKSLNHITSDTVITAKWKINTYTVTFTDGCGKTLKTQTVEYNKNATPPITPSREGYKFMGWDKSYNNIKNNTVINAKWKELYSYELRLLSTETYDTNNNGHSPCAMFFLKTNQPDYHNIFLYDGKNYLQLDSAVTNESYHSSYPKWHGVYLNDTDLFFIDETKIQGFIMLLPIGKQYILCEKQGNDFVRLKDTNAPITIKSSQEAKTNWFQNIKQKYEQNVQNMNLQNADSAIKFSQALYYPILEDIRDNQSYSGYRYNGKTVRGGDAFILQKGGFASKGLWSYHHYNGWASSIDYPRIGAELVKYVMGDEIEDAYGVCNGNTGYTEICNKPGYTSQTLCHGYTYVRFKDSPKTGGYYKKGFLISGDRDEKLDTARYNQLRDEVTNLCNNTSHICWSISV